ncbi:MAG: methionyl-tRNA formyltransferase [Oscillospiraceae bacterium]
MRILFMGTPDFAAESLRALIESGFDVAGVFTQPDKPVGRKQKLESPPVKVLAEKHGIPVFQPTKLRDGTALNIIKGLAPELIAVVAYGRILPKDILDYPKYGCINIHGSILPKYRGSAPIQWAVINGEKETGVTAMYMAEEMDAGDIIEARRTEILPGETSGELFSRLAPIGAGLLCDTIRNILSGNFTRTPQDSSCATFAPPLTKDMSDISWAQEGEKIVSKINGLNPWPVASAEINGTRFKLFAAHNTLEPVNSVPGTIVSAGNGGIAISCTDGTVTITELQAPGGKRMKAGDYLRGHPICL